MSGVTLVSSSRENYYESVCLGCDFNEDHVKDSQALKHAMETGHTVNQRHTTVTYVTAERDNLETPKLPQYARTQSGTEHQHGIANPLGWIEHDHSGGETPHYHTPDGVAIELSSAVTS